MAVEVKPGDLDAVDFEYQRRHAGWLTRALHRYFRADIQGLENLPEGPFLGVGNHSGAALIPDTLVWIGAYHTSGRQPPLVTLAHDGMFDQYPQGLARALGKLGAVRANRDNTLEALRRGWAVQVYPGGDDDACRSFSRRNEIVFAGRKGYVEMAREARVPIVPVVSVGGHEALFVFWEGAWLAKKLGYDKRFRLKRFPLSWSLPWGFWLGPLPGYWPLPTKISVRVLPPISAEHGNIDDIDTNVREAMQRTADQLAKGRRSWLG
jgi:1-acyl-sn-glycerol-3-phosphate acyltransferase